MIIARAYALGEPSNWGPDCDEEMRKQVDLWNKLVRLDRADRAKFEALLRESNVVTALDAEIDDLASQKQAAYAERKALRAAKRGKVATPDLDARIADLTGRIKDASRRRRETRAAVRLENKPKFDALTAKHDEAVKEARNASGLFWTNYNAVCQSYSVARSRAMKQKAMLRERRYADERDTIDDSDVRPTLIARGEGRITQQIQHGVGIEGLFAGASNQVQVAPISDDVWNLSSRGERRRRCRTTLTLAIYRRMGQYRTCTFPLHLHRPLPEGGVIKQVVVTRRRMANEWRWKVVFTIDVPDATAHAVAIDLGWRRIENDGLRVATFLRGGMAAPEHIKLPEDWLAKQAHVEEIYSDRVTDANETIHWLRTLPWPDAPDALRAKYAPLSVVRPHNKKTEQARFLGPPALMAALAIEWRQHDWRPTDRDRLESWRKSDKRLWLESKHLKDKLQARRTNDYRLAARKIVAGSNTVILEEFDIAEAARLEDAAGRGNPLVQAQRRYRVLACVHDLRHWIEHAATKAGLKIVRHSGVSTWLCHECRAPIEPAQPDVLVQKCPSCSAVWDQDENACRNMLAAHEASAGDPQSDPSALDLDAA